MQAIEPDHLRQGNRPPRQRVAGLDGLRGLAALFVVVHHIFMRAFPGYPVDRAPFWAGWLIYGRFAVLVFIVLSGFSLALSPARAEALPPGSHVFAHVPTAGVRLLTLEATGQA